MPIGCFDGKRPSEDLNRSLNTGPRGILRLSMTWPTVPFNVTLTTRLFHGSGGDLAHFSIFLYCIPLIFFIGEFGDLLQCLALYVLGTPVLVHGEQPGL